MDAFDAHHDDAPYFEVRVYPTEARWTANQPDLAEGHAYPQYDDAVAYACGAALSDCYEVVVLDRSAPSPAIIYARHARPVPKVDAQNQQTSPAGQDALASDDRNDATVLVPPSQWAEFDRRVAKLNAKAQQFGLNPIEITSTDTVVYERRATRVNDDLTAVTLVPFSGEGSEGLIALTRVQLRYPIVKLGNWDVVGKLEAVDDGNLTFCVTRDPADQEILELASSHPIECEHCRTSRRRTESYLVRDVDSSEYKQVGTGCLKDFTGVDPSAVLFLASLATFIRHADGDTQSFAATCRTNAIHTAKYLADVSFLADQFGFISSAMAREKGYRPTYDEAMDIDGVLRGNKELLDKYRAQRVIHLAKAEKIRLSVAAMAPRTSYERNVQLLLKPDAIQLDRKHLAVAAGAIPMYKRQLAKDAEMNRPSVHVGQKGEKHSGLVALAQTIPITNMYGNMLLVILHDKNGNRLRWKTAACPDMLKVADPGQSFDATYKIKEHSHYDGVAQTNITHVKLNAMLVDELPPPDCPAEGTGRNSMAPDL